MCQGLLQLGMLKQTATREEAIERRGEIGLVVSLDKDDSMQHAKR